MPKSRIPLTRKKMKMKSCGMQICSLLRDDIVRHKRWANCVLTILIQQSRASTKTWYCQTKTPLLLQLLCYAFVNLPALLCHSTVGRLIRGAHNAAVHIQFIMSSSAHERLSTRIYFLTALNLKPIYKSWAEIMMAFLRDRVFSESGICQ